MSDLLKYTAHRFSIFTELELLDTGATLFNLDKGLN